jgi:hypothetical protein
MATASATIRDEKHSITPLGREAGASPAQSRYGDHRQVEVRSPAQRRLLTFERKGRHDASDRLIPLLRTVEARGR